MQSLTAADLLRLWRAVVSQEYARQLVEVADSGVEVIEQLAEQFAAAAGACGRTVAQMFILPHSSQEYPPAAGAARATVTLSLSRSTAFDRLVVIPRGRAVAESVTDASDEGAISVLTGRRYLVTAPVPMLPGIAGPVAYTAEAERIGDGYNLPAPETLTRWSNEPTGSGVGGEVLAGNTFALGTGDSLGPDHVGAYLEILGGSNAGALRQVVAVLGDGLVSLDSYWTLTGTTVGAWIAGEPVTRGGSTIGTLVGVDGSTVAIDSTATLAAGDVLTGRESGATVTVASLIASPALTPDTLVPWQLRTLTELGIAVSNEQSPTGGRQAWLDELGWERMIDRSPQEADDAYRERVAAIPDAVSPNAILRAANRVLAPYGLSAAFREPGTPTWPGMFYDASNPALGSAFDLSTAEASYRLTTSLRTYRAFFYLVVPAIPPVAGAAIAYDAESPGMFNAFDVLGSVVDATASIHADYIYRKVIDAVRPVVGGGVQWELLVEE